MAAENSNKVRVIILGPVDSGKSALLGEIYTALYKQGIKCDLPDGELQTLRSQLPHERLRELQEYNPQVTLRELSHFQAFTYLPQEFRKIAEEIARNNPGEATKAMFRQRINEMQGLVDEIASWDIMR